MRTPRGSDHIPSWARALLALERASGAAHRLASATRLELLCALLPAAQRDALTRQLYERAETFARGGDTFAQGLFDWEQAALAHPAFPRAGRVLLGGAGGGRELAALCARGYHVLALEPAVALARSADEVARAASPGRAQVFAASYSDLVRAVAARSGVLWDALERARPFEAVVLGWGSFAHVTERADREALLATLRVLAPRAPVLVSYLARSDGGEQSRVEQVAARLRRGLGALGAPGARTPGLRFYAHGGFVAELTPGDLDAEARAAGYEPAFHLAQPRPHALLRARSGAD